MTDEPPKNGDEPEDELAARLAEIEEKVRAARQKAAPPASEDLDARLDALKASAQQARHGFSGTRRVSEKEERLTRESTRGVGVGLAIAYAIVGIPMLGAFVGWAIDARTGSFVWRSVLAVAGMILGIVAAVVMINRTNEDR